MATTPPAKAALSSKKIEKTEAKSPIFSTALLVGWLVPGGGHLLMRRWARGGLLFAAIGLMFILGLLMQGKLYVFTPGDPLVILGFIADLGSGLMYIGGRIAGVGQTPVQVVTADYGTKFIVVAGLLNVIAAVDAHNIRIGRKS